MSKPTHGTFKKTPVHVVAWWEGKWSRYVFDYDHWRWLPMVMSHRPTKDFPLGKKPIECPKCHCQNWYCYDDNGRGVGYMRCEDCGTLWVEGA